MWINQQGKRKLAAWTFLQAASAWELIGAYLQVHLILRHKKPNGDIEEKHLDAPPAVNLDKLTHVYTAIIDTDNRYSHLSNTFLQQQCSCSMEDCEC